MSATQADLDLIREASAKMRADAAACGDKPTDLIPAVADWLRTAGADLWAHGPLCYCDDGCMKCDDELWAPHVRRALAVARAYLGRSS